MRVTEEHVTRALARCLAGDNWRVVAVHPPDGQGPFVIPSSPEIRAIERSSYHPDVVAIRATDAGSHVLIAECKDRAAALKDDYAKLTAIARSRSALLFALFRCQTFEFGPVDGIDYDVVSQLPTAQLPVEFAVAAPGASDNVTIDEPIEGFPCTRYSFSSTTLLGG